MKKLLNSILVVTSVMLMASVTSAKTVVVVGSNSSISTTTKSDIVKVFLGKKKELGGVKVIPIDQSQDSAARMSFYEDTVKKSEAQLKSYWSRLIFTGKGQAPQEVGSGSEVKSMISSNPNIIGYIDESNVDGSVKVIYTP